jgi:hypothetical protein
MIENRTEACGGESSCAAGDYGFEDVPVPGGFAVTGAGAGGAGGAVADESKVDGPVGHPEDRP